MYNNSSSSSDSKSESQFSEYEDEGTIIWQAQKGGKFALIVLTLVNLINFMDRYLPSSTKEWFKEDLNLSDTQTSLPITVFMVVFMLGSPIFGFLSDIGYSRKGLISFGIILWCLATTATYFVVDFWTFLLARTTVGIGEAGLFFQFSLITYGTIAPALLSDFYPPNQRNKVLSIFYSAIPVGAALGNILGGILGQLFGWRSAFLILGVPGCLLAILVMKIQDPGRGVFEKEQKNIGFFEAFKILFKNKNYMIALAGYVLLNFSVGAMADWLPTYISRIDKVSPGFAASATGAVIVVGGVAGTFLGSFAGQKLQGRTKNPYFCVCGISTLTAGLFSISLLLLESFVSTIVFLTITMILIFGYNGPLNAILANCVDSNIRTRAFSTSILFIHLFGDAISPTIIGILSDNFGLKKAYTIVPIFIIASGLVWCFGWKIADIEKHEKDSIGNIALLDTVESS